MDRSIGLLKSLGIEKERWEATSETFRAQMSTIVGDTLLSAAFIAYAGYFDQQYRNSLFGRWCSHLQVRAMFSKTHHKPIKPSRSRRYSSKPRKKRVRLGPTE